MQDISFFNNHSLVNQFLNENKENIANEIANFDPNIPSMSKRYAIRQ